MRLLYKILLIANLITTIVALNGFHFNLDLNQTSKQNTTLYNSSCNNYPYINFTFSNTTMINNCFTERCNITNSRSSKLLYQDGNFIRVQYSLQGIYLNKNPYRSNAQLQLIFVYDSQTNVNMEIWVIVPLIFMKPISIQSKDPDSRHIIEIQGIDPYHNNSQSLSEIRFFHQFVDFLMNKHTRNLHKTFQFLNLRDYSKFYHLSGSKDANSKTIQFLFSRFIYHLIKHDTIGANNLQNLNLDHGTVNYSLTGNHYCFCSQQPFQSNIHQSIAFWTSWFYILIACVTSMWPRNKTENLWNHRFSQNKWTTWSLYSIFHLQHDQFFTRPARILIPLVKISIHMLILSLFHLFLTHQLYAIPIAFAFVPAVIAGQIFGQVCGHVFLRRINQEHIRKIKLQYEDLLLERKIENKQNEEAILDSQTYLYTLYFWYYVIIFLLFVVPQVLAIYILEQLPYNFHEIGGVYWLVSLGICFLLDNFVVDLLLTVCFGNTYFMRSNGFFYDIQIGKIYKKTLQLLCT